MPATYICSFLTGAWPNGTRELGERYARIVAGMAREFAPGAEFVLFSDRKKIEGVNVRTIPNLDGWWGSLYQFSPEAFPEGSRVFSIDLDTTIVGDLKPLLEVPLDKLVGLNDTGPQGVWTRRLANGVMSWQAGPRYYPIWERFVPNIGKRRPFVLDGKFVTQDEQWLKHFIGYDWTGWSDLFGKDAVMSYKWHLLSQRRTITAETKIIYFHGQPRPHQVKQVWNPHYLPPRIPSR